MKRLIGRNTWLAIAVAFLASGAGVTPAAAQNQQLGAGDRITILVPNLAPQNGANDNFGEDVAEDLRELINELHTHQTVTRRQMNRAMERFSQLDSIFGEVARIRVEYLH